METIRTWERRYGFPESQRNKAGHRIYGLTTIEELRLITSVIDQGYRPSQLKDCSQDELQDLLDRSTEAEEAEEEPPCVEEPCLERLEYWVKAVRTLDRELLEGYFRSEFSRLSALQFLEERVAPFLEAVGERWARGDLSILHEHFGSECLHDFLVSAWRPLSDMARGERVVLGTFSGEHHCLGTHMVALVTAITGHKVVFLGANIPATDIALAAKQCEPKAVALSVSQFADPATTVMSLTKLRELVPEQTEILVGGAGASIAPKGVTILGSLSELYRYLDGPE